LAKKGSSQKQRPLSINDIADKHQLNVNASVDVLAANVPLKMACMSHLSTCLVKRLPCFRPIMAKSHPKVGWAPIGFAVAAPCTNLPEGIVLSIVLI